MYTRACGLPIATTGAVLSMLMPVTFVDDEFPA
jgi:hypothetical protein